MTGKLRKGIKDLVAEANAIIETVPTGDAVGLLGDPGTVFVDIRDVRELERDGMIPDAAHAPRGMIEFWFDPESPYHKPAFADDTKKYLLYCASAWRSALATKALSEMGFTNVAHVEGGFGAWKAAGGPVAEHEKKQPKA